MPSHLPLAVLALDAADPDRLAAWAPDGHLPTLAFIMDTGWWERTIGSDLNIEHGAWVSLLSGRSRREHGYHYFRQFVDLETDESVIERPERTRDVFGPDASETLPDLFVHWQPIPRFLRRVQHPRVELVQDEPEFFRDSAHTPYGFIAASGPAFATCGCASDVDVLSVAPRLRAALGLAASPSEAPPMSSAA